MMWRMKDIMRERQYSLDVIKIAATVFILFHHYQQYISGVFSTGVNYYGGVFNFGLMVELFFVLSGYFMFPYIEKIRGGLPLKRFFLPRLKRLLPMVAIAAFGYQGLVFCYIKFVGTEWFMKPSGLWHTIVAALGMQEGWVFKENTYVNYPVWYVSVLLLCYVVFFCGTYIASQKKISARYVYLFLIFLGIAIESYQWNYPFLNAYTARGYYAFFAGALLSTYCYEKKTGRKEGILSLLVVLLLVSLIAFCPALVKNGIHYISTFILYPALILVFKTEPALRILSGRAMKTVADIAFHTYLWHLPIIVFVLLLLNKVFMGADIRTRACMWIFAAASFAIGTLSYFLYEKTIGRWLETK